MAPHRISRRSCIAAAALLPGVFARAATVFPDHPIFAVVPYPPGGGSDLTARALNAQMGSQLKTQVIVENIGGAAGAIAVNKVLGAPADGYSLFLGSPNELVLSGLTNKAIRYRPEDFQFVAPVANAPFVVIARNGLPVATVDELVALARQHPEAPLSFGSIGQGSLPHLIAALLSKNIGVPMTHVPYKGASALNQDLIGGQIDFAIITYQAVHAEFAQQGRLKILATLNRHPLPGIPNVPSTAGSHWMKDFDFTIWTAYLVKKGTPMPVVERLNAAIDAAVRDPAARAQLAAQGKTFFEPMDVAAGARFYASETARLHALIDTLGYQAE